MNKMIRERPLLTSAFFSKETCLGISALLITPEYFISVKKLVIFGLSKKKPVNKGIFGA